MPDQRLVLITLRSEERNVIGSRPTGLVRLESGDEKATVEANVQNLSEQGGYFLFIAGDKLEKLDLRPNARGYGIKHEIDPGRVKAAFIGKFDGDNLRFLLSGVAMGASVNMERLKTEIRIQFGKKQEIPVMQSPVQVLPEQKSVEEPAAQIQESKEEQIESTSEMKPEQETGAAGEHPAQQQAPQDEIPPYDVGKGSTALKGILKKAAVLFPRGECASLDLNQPRIKSKVYTPKSMNEQQKRWYMDVDKIISSDDKKTEEPMQKENPLEYVRRRRPVGKRSIPNPFPGEFKMGVWYMVRYSGMISKHYIIGRVRRNGKLLTVVGVPGEYSVNPPSWLTDFNRFVTSTSGQGYWLQSIDISTGKPVTD